MNQISADISEQANDQKRFFSNSRPVTFIALAAVTVWALFTGYVSLFGFIASHDDEGYVMMTVKQFLDGRVLYDEIFSQYGPGYYLYKWLFFNLTGLAVSHDVTRLTALAVWTLTALVCAVLVLRLTRSTIAAAAAYALTFLGLYRTIYEPEHPQSLCALLVALGLFLISFQNGKRRVEILTGLTGAILALLLFAKINIGIFFGLALAIVFLSYFQPSRWQRATLWILIAGATAVPFVLFRKHLFTNWGYLCLTVALSLCAAFVSVRKKDFKSVFNAKHALIFILLFAATSFLIILFALTNGTSFAALLNVLILQNLKFGEAFYSLAPINFSSVVVALLGLAGAIGYKFFGGKMSPVKLNLLIAAAKTAFGVALILISLLGGGERRYYMLINFGISFLWLVLIPPLKDKDNFSAARAALVFMAILLVLQTYPIVGSQLSFGSFVILIAAVLCLSDAAHFWRELAFVKNSALPLGKITAAFAALIISAVCLYPALTFYRTFRAQLPLELPGATRFRLPENEVAKQQFLVRNLVASCDDFMTMPGKMSYFFWTQKEPPTTYNTTAWMTLLDDRQQQAIVDKLNASPRPCAVYHPYLANAGLRGQTLDSFVLSGYILQDFRTRGEVGEHQFMIPRTSSADMVYYARFAKDATSSDDSYELSFSRPNDLPIARIQVYDFQNNRVIADSADNSITNDNAQSLNFPEGKNTDSYSLEKLRFVSTAADLQNENLLLRLFDANGNRVATIPFVGEY